MPNVCTKCQSIVYSRHAEIRLLSYLLPLTHFPSLSPTRSSSSTRSPSSFFHLQPCFHSCQLHHLNFDRYAVVCLIRTCPRHFYKCCAFIAASYDTLPVLRLTLNHFHCKLSIGNRQQQQVTVQQQFPFLFPSLSLCLSLPCSLACSMPISLTSLYSNAGKTLMKLCR